MPRPLGVRPATPPPLSPQQRATWPPAPPADPAPPQSDVAPVDLRGVGAPTPEDWNVWGGADPCTALAAFSPEAIGCTCGRPVSKCRCRGGGFFVDDGGRWRRKDYGSEQTLALFDALPFARATAEEIRLFMGKHVPSAPITPAHPQWVRDAAAPSCALCRRRFSFLRRRHHCRGCGKVMCAGCAPRRACAARGPYFAHWSGLRQCHKCYSRLVRWLEPRSERGAPETPPCAPAAPGAPPSPPATCPSPALGSPSASPRSVATAPAPALTRPARLDLAGWTVPSDRRC
eukprot:TRINITY_DN69955_c0_g1_i1.p1 TRINITY_DN69955_c0_g1~~TRINITY_DN69955_c0_g1_i1.p1  ORF type:complete len:288 (+),score=50.14 TRINITY_DN69955_c0_g1_i1:105-968(+)